MFSNNARNNDYLYGNNAYGSYSGYGNSGLSPLTGYNKRNVNVGYDTSGKDPISMRSRVFAGNLSKRITREDIVSFFSNYGNLHGVTLFKGYAFVQYKTPTEADLAISALNGYNWGGSILDVKLACLSELGGPAAIKSSPVMGGGGGYMGGGGGMTPSPNYSRLSGGGGGGMSAGMRFNASPLVAKKMGGGSARKADGVSAGASALKRMRLDLGQEAIDAQNAANRAYAAAADETVVDVVQHAGAVDTLICGECHQVATSVAEFVEHRKKPCSFFKALGEPLLLQCFNCTEEFKTSWALLKHLHDEHKLKLFKEKAGVEDPATNGSQTSAQALDAPQQMDATDFSSDIIALQ